MSVIYLLFYVDDMIVTGNSTQLISLVTKFLSTQFKIKNLGQVNYFLGIQVTRTMEGVFATQRKYANDILSNFLLLSLRVH